MGGHYRIGHLSTLGNNDDFCGTEIQIICKDDTTKWNAEISIFLKNRLLVATGVTPCAMFALTAAFAVRHFEYALRNVCAYSCIRS